MNLTDKIAALEIESEVLETSPELRSKWNSIVNDASSDFIDSLSEVSSYTTGKISTEKYVIRNAPDDFKSLIDLYFKEVSGIGIKAASGGHIGYIPGGGIYPSSLADYLVAATNVYSGMAYASNGAVTIEQSCINWMIDLFGFPKGSVGNLTSGGSIANLIALTAARDAHNIKNEKISSSVIYLSEQVHHCIQKALRIIGLEDAIIRYIPLSEDHKLLSAELRKCIQEDIDSGLNPFLVVGSAGTTDTGAIDPLNAMADIAKNYKLWFHVDAAYGGFFYLLDELKPKFAGIERADSLVIDPHKGLFLPYGLGAVLVKNKEAVFHSNHYTANYMQDTLGHDSLINPADVSPELTKHFRGMRMWLPLKALGIAPFIACLREKILLTEYFREELKKMGFSVGPAPDLSVSYFWYAKSDEFNKRLMKKIHQDGEIFLSSSTISDRYVIRIAVLSFRTKKKTIDRALGMIKRCLQELL
ncbi:MAG: aminotransferase class V-fold PLP-dependent enzyme [Crocinitomicaceae bacterium]|nr:aminotransferase class V-fold PLP-dependent enzyme [Crocinitomicaceae bacterium]